MAEEEGEKDKKNYKFIDVTVLPVYHISIQKNVVKRPYNDEQPKANELNKNDEEEEVKSLYASRENRRNRKRSRQNSSNK